MCYGCWEQEGKPSIVNERTELVADFVRNLDKRSGSGCCLHIVTDDFNIDDGHVQFCLDEARKAVHPECEALAGYLLDLSREERGSVLAIREGWIDATV